jgi:superfamily I DNA/RNA helicase
MTEQAEERVFTAATDDEDTIGELQVAEYLLLLFAYNNYILYLDEAGQDEGTDGHARAGLKLLRIVDRRNSDQIQSFLLEKVEREVSQRNIKRTFRVKVANSVHAGRRSDTLRRVLSRGGAATLKAVFDNARARKAARTCMTATASGVDPAEAMAVFAKVAIQNVRIKSWVRRCLALLSGEDQFETSVAEPKSAPVEAAADVAASATNALRESQLTEEGANAFEDAQAAEEKQSEILSQVQEEATAAAAEALEIAGQEDAPVTKSEVVGIATAAAVAASAETGDTENVPESLKRLDPEQLAAALTDGRVLVAAGAGSGKSWTLVARVAYLIKERQVAPGRILATSFNAEAAVSLKGKVAREVGSDFASQMSGGGGRWTMHSIFKSQIKQFGTPDEVSAMKADQSKVAGVTAQACQNIWEECFDSEERPVPVRKTMERYKSLWSGNGVTPAEAKKLAAESGDPEQVDAADWYEMYEGLKGAIPGWTPPCEEKSRDALNADYQRKLDAWRYRGSRGRPPKRRDTTFESYMGKLRPQGERVGDFDDMIIILRDILKREPGVRKHIQKMFDHVLVDECQDLNLVQHEIFEMITEHIEDGDGRSLWLVGDDKQSIYGFRGSRADMFIDLHDQEGWTTRLMTTNYRCPPEVIEAANRLASHNEKQIPMEAKPAPGRPRGQASLRVLSPQDDMRAALDVVEEIKKDVGSDDPVEVRNNLKGQYAVLCRTNSEVHAYETACIVRGIPYARKGTSSVFGSAETKPLLSYLQVLTGDDNVKKQAALGLILNKPNRFFINDDKAKETVKVAVREYAAMRKIRINEVDPLSALEDYDFQQILAGKLSASEYAKKMNAERLAEMSDALAAMRLNMQSEDYRTTDLFDEILALRGMTSKADPSTGKREFVSQSLREAMLESRKNSRGDDSSDEDEAQAEDDGQPFGALAFLYELTEADPTDPGDMEDPPGTPFGFKAKMDRYVTRMRELNTDLEKYKGEREDLEAVYLGTVHSTKGAEWPNVYAAMPFGKFPIIPKRKPGQPPPPPEEEQERMESERRLAYVSLTRAQSNLTVVCPKEVDGKDAGISPFVGEAGLSEGENVPRPDVEGAAAEPETGEPKTAAVPSSFIEDLWSNWKAASEEDH